MTCESVLSKRPVLKTHAASFFLKTLLKSFYLVVGLRSAIMGAIRVDFGTISGSLEGSVVLRRCREVSLEFDRIVWGNVANDIVTLRYLMVHELL